MAKPTQSGGIHFEQMPDADAVGRKAADMVLSQLGQKPDSSLVFPTGNTPLPMYKELRHAPYSLWAKSRLFHLDEYIIPPDAPKRLPYQTYAEYMNDELWGLIGGRKHYFAHYVDRPAEYEALVRENDGPDMVILGIGANGHIAFNEPGSAPDSPARMVDLADETIVSNFRSVGKKGFPTQAVTLGLDAILSAKKIVLLATGEGKRDILRRAFDPATPPSADLPASWLKRHPDVTIITDFPL